MIMPDANEVSRERCGFKPGSLVEPPPQQGEDNDPRCYPEMDACAGTGLGQCLFTWRRGETIINVETIGDQPPQVQGVYCRVNC